MTPPEWSTAVAEQVIRPTATSTDARRRLGLTSEAPTAIAATTADPPMLCSSVCPSSSP